MIKQKTIKHSVSIRGVGLHSGKPVEVTFHPAPCDYGIVFRRVDMPQPNEIPAKFDQVSTTDLATKLTFGNSSVATVEHLLSAFVGLSLDNVLVELTSEEVPILDGSSLLFIQLLQAAGIEEQSKAKNFIKITKTCKVGTEDSWASLEPFDGFCVKFTIEFNHPVFKNGPQWIEFHVNTIAYAKEISSARTFGFMSDLEKLRAKNLAQGGGLANAVVLDDSKVINKEGLRFDDEMVRHKVLDAIGDLFLIGGTLVGKFSGYKSGHKLTNELLRKIHTENAWETVTLS
ncbi:MAG: UDP-3-O-acyl-N-acetylglucosamine deacetylase [Methylacidiphilales bacterium]|nr:UDP-3-O-acyl-N-acetylglucosamine deacetylase [Candidatus Methylacidiphilales bacterium]